MLPEALKRSDNNFQPHHVVTDERILVSSIQYTEKKI